MAVFETPFRVAVTVRVAVVPTADEVIEKVFVVVLFATVALAGVVIDPLLSVRVTTAPPLPAGLLTVTVPVVALPPLILFGVMLSAVSTAGGWRVTFAVLTTANKVAVTVRVAAAPTALDVIEKVPVADPVLTVP